MTSSPTDSLESSQSTLIGEHLAEQSASDAMLEVALENLAAAGPVDQPQKLRDYLPNASPEIRLFVLFELIKLDMSLAAEQGELRLIDHYTCSLSDLLSPANIPLDLVMEEIQLRRDCGETPSADEYRERFPQFGSLLGPLLGANEATTAVRGRGVPPELAIGTQVDDFLILQKLGQGAFAHVYLARQISMQRLVALKISRGGGGESQALAQFDHPNIVRVFDQRRCEIDGLDLLYMQYHPGGTIAEVVHSLRKRRSTTVTGQVLLDAVDRNLLNAAQVVPDRSATRRWLASAAWPMAVAWIGVQLAKALDEAHRRGVLHRDVKPANVLLSAEGIPHLADFNVSFSGAAGRAGAASSFGGSIGYMAPEHLRAISAELLDEPHKVKEPADLYSLAILLWELWQGTRPFVSEGTAASWSDTIRQQLQSRSRPLAEPHRLGNASERVMEKVLRSALATSPSERPSSGAEMAGRLRLALHPEAAVLFDPDERSWCTRFSCVSPWLVTGTVILMPNIAAGIFNYSYNQREIMTQETQHVLKNIAFYVNLIAYPLSFAIMLWFTRNVASAMEKASRGALITSNDIHKTLELGHRAAVIGGTCWFIAGLIYPIALYWMCPGFTATHAVHFFISLLICGGVAMIYPLFGLALITTFVYYPRLLRSSMQDPEFDSRAKQMVTRCERYLVIAILIPMLAAALLVSGEGGSRDFKYAAIAAGVGGFLASFFAYRVIANTWSRMAEVLSSKTSVLPGELGS